KDACDVNGRKLSPRAQDVMTVLADIRLRPSRDPIGMIAGIFCDGVTVRNIDVGRSIVLDHGVFLKSVSFSSITGAANLSLTRTGVVQDLSIERSRIAGGVYAWNAVIGALNIFQSNIGLHVDASEALFVDAMTIDQSKINGPVSLDNSTLQALVVV